MVAEVDKVAPGEWTARLLHAAADYEAAKMNRREAEAGDQILHEAYRLLEPGGHLMIVECPRYGVGSLIRA